MRPDWFGDSYDIVKRFLLSTLAQGGFRRWRVHPMFTEETSEEIADAFEHLLGAPLICREKVTARNRASVLDVARTAGHLLLDPDTGICMEEPSGSQSRHHLYLDELVSLVRARPLGLTAVFDQSIKRVKGASRDEQLEEKLGCLRAKRLQAFAYKSHACFLFAAMDSALLTKAHALLSNTGLPLSRDGKPGLTRFGHPLSTRKP
jgi:hypothetical protein